MNEKPTSPTENPFEGHPARVMKTHHLPTGALSLATRDDASRLYAACIDGGIYELDLEAEKPEPVALGWHDRYASGVHALAGGETLVSAGYDGQVRWHDARKRQELRRVKAHSFWSWQLAVHEGSGRLASAGGQYLCGGYKYEPREASEPPVQLIDLASGETLQKLDHVPPVQSVAFSADGKFLAAGNLMGEVRVWSTEGGEELARFTTPSFTGWGIIKGHYYTGGIFSMFFSPDGEDLFVAGMGSTRDPAAGNGRQLWQRFRWREEPARKVDETHDKESGSGLMETIALHPSGRYFVMGGRIAKGNWNVAFFDAKTGSILHSLSTKTRVTRATFSPAGDRLFLSAAVTQQRPKDGKIPPWGRVHEIEVPAILRAF